jgi:hypothetical protein
MITMDEYLKLWGMCKDLFEAIDGLEVEVDLAPTVSDPEKPDNLPKEKEIVQPEPDIPPKIKDLNLILSDFSKWCEDILKETEWMK